MKTFLAILLMIFLVIAMSIFVGNHAADVVNVYFNERINTIFEKAK